jgi:hypothetical protein
MFYFLVRAFWRSLYTALALGAYGKNSDGGILSHANLRMALGQGTSRKSVVLGTANEAPYVIVGDEARDLKLLGEKINTTKKNANAVRRTGKGNEFTFMPVTRMQNKFVIRRSLMT